jgi:hypothetical protein
MVEHDARADWSVVRSRLMPLRPKYGVSGSVTEAQLPTRRHRLRELPDAA